MGLDIYLRKCPDLAYAQAQEEKYEKATEALWTKKYDETPEHEKEANRAKSEELKGEFGIIDYWHGSIEKIEIDSAIKPDHMFKIGYFRSSYNSGGMEHILRNLSLPTLHDIFGYEDETGDEFTPDWAAALVKVDESIAGYQAHLSGPTGGFGVMEVRPIWGRGAKDEIEAMAMFSKQLEQHEKRGPDSDMRWFSNGEGNYFMGGTKVHAVITKKFEPRRPGDNPLLSLINGPAVFVVYEKEKPKAEEEDWYLTALRIVRETIEYVLAQPDKQIYFLSWSG